ncbi:MAG TPA: class I SAM-dependent methyltransferase [Solirubrobacteraceae bacterium]|nr:class I SAM-dependent methyltransferase [Solirubrobacteraceae bacterium]
MTDEQRLARAAGHPVAGATSPAARIPVPTGNTFDKYGSAHPVVRRLMAGFERAAAELLDHAAPRSLLDVGCGEGVLTERWAARDPGCETVGVDLPDPELAARWAERPPRANLRFATMEAEALAFDDDAFELVAATEVLEHVADPWAALVEMGRVAARWLLVSVPREPLWRMLNLGRGAYLAELGNTPGHLHHWTPASFRRLLAAHGEIVCARAPLPWTMLLVRVG